jgi:hypothetical protein
MTKKCTVCGDPFDNKPVTSKKTGKTFTPSMCFNCAMMVGKAKAKREREVGSGSIRGALPDGEYVQYERHQVMWLMIQEHTPEFEYNLPDEKEFTENTLLRRTPYIIRKLLDQKGFTEITWDEIEDIACDVNLAFLERMEDEMDDPIRNVWTYHWSLCRGLVRRYMQQFVERRMATVSAEVLEWTDSMGLSRPYANQFGATESIALHNLEQERTEPRWVSVKADTGLRVELEEADLTKAEVAALLNALSGENKGRGGPRRNRRKLNSAVKKMEEAGVSEAVIRRLKS